MNETNLTQTMEPQGIPVPEAVSPVKWRKIPFAIFQKDFKILAGQMGCVLAIQALLMAAVPGVNALMAQWTGSKGSFDIPLYEWFPKLQLAINVLMALLAACQWSAEERQGQNDWLLRRLPISRQRIQQEKIAAGLAILAVILFIQYLWHLFFTMLGIMVWNYDDWVGSSLVLNTLLAYLLGLPLSAVLNQSITVILTGLAVIYLGLWGYSVYQSKTLQAWRYLTLFGLAAAGYVGALSSAVWRRGILWEQPRFTLLLRKQRREMRVFLALSLLLAGLFIGSTVLSASDRDGWLVLMGTACGLYAIGVGVSIYAAREKDGIRCVLYQHSIPLREIFGVKFGHGLLLMGIPAMVWSLAGLAVFLNEIYYRSGWMPHDLWEGLLVLVSIIGAMFGIALVAYVCGVMATLALQNSIYAFFLALPMAVLPLVLLFRLQYPIFLVVSVPFPNQYDANPIPFFPLFAWSLFLLVIGLSLAAARMATDRQVLTGSAGARLLYAGRIYLFTLAAVILLIKTGWKDLLYLVTNVNVGMG